MGFVHAGAVRWQSWQSSWQVPTTDRVDRPRVERPANTLVPLLSQISEGLPLPRGLGHAACGPPPRPVAPIKTQRRRSLSLRLLSMSIVWRAFLVFLQAAFNQAACTPPHKTPEKFRYHTEEPLLLQIAPLIFKVCRSFLFASCS